MQRDHRGFSRRPAASGAAEHALGHGENASWMERGLKIDPQAAWVVRGGVGSGARSWHGQARRRCHAPAGGYVWRMLDCMLVGAGADGL